MYVLLCVLDIAFAWVEGICHFPPFSSADGLSDWTFTSVAFWGEEPEGVWSLSVTTDVSSEAE